MNTYGVTIVSRNDDYGGNLLERATYCLNSMSAYFDQVIYVDWATEDGKPTIVEEIQQDLLKYNNIYWIRVTEKQAKEWTNNNPDAQGVCEVLARNIGLRRLGTDFMASSNIDIVAPQRRHIEKFTDKNTFFTVGRRDISLFDLRPLGAKTSPADYMPPLELLEKKYPQHPRIQTFENDYYSLVSNCGDLQIAHRDIWYTIRGFEERLMGRGYADSNVQRKAKVYGFNIDVDWTVPIWHIGHQGGMGGSGGMNDGRLAVFMEETTNTINWGHIDSGLEMHLV